MKERYELKMRVVLVNPNCEDGTDEERMYDYDCYFNHDEETYGNGWYCNLCPKDKNFMDRYFDLRYSKYRITSEERAKEFLTDWANEYWNGENGAWKVKQIIFK